MAFSFLSGVRVLDLSQFLPGPFATQMLADLGADVIKVEPPSGDPMRKLDPITNERVASAYHPLVNAGKSVVEIDLKSDTGHAQFLLLLKSADAVLESYRPGVMDRLGLDWDRINEVNPSLVYCALSGFGQNGPNRLRAGHDINYVAAAGQLALTGNAEKPNMAFPMVADYSGALQSVISILAALVGRGKTGKGAYLDVAMADCVAAWQAQTLTAVASGSKLSRGGNLLTGGAACYGVYRTADDKFVSLGAIETVFWENFCKAVSRTDLIHRQMEELPQTGLIGEVEAIFGSETRSHWDEKLGEVDCCYHPVMEPSELQSSTQLTARNLVAMQEGAGDSATTVLFPAWVDGAPPRERPAMKIIDIETALEMWGQPGLS